MGKGVDPSRVTRGGGVGSIDGSGYGLDILLAGLVVQIFDSPFFIQISRECFFLQSARDNQLKTGGESPRSWFVIPDL